MWTGGGAPRPPGGSVSASALRSRRRELVEQREPKLPAALVFEPAGTPLLFPLPVSQQRLPLRLHSVVVLLSS